MHNMLENQPCVVSRAKLMQFPNVLYNMRFPVLLTETLGKDIWNMTFLIFSMKLPAPNVHRGSHLCPMGAYMFGMQVDVGAVMK